jgi:hypothetical protein
LATNFRQVIEKRKAA